MSAPQEAVDSALALVRDMAKWMPSQIEMAIGSSPQRQCFDEARRIAALLPKPDPARQRVRDLFGFEAAQGGLGDAAALRAIEIASGRGDGFWEARIALAAYRAGQEASNG